MYATSFGTMNALAIGTPATGVTAVPLSNGTLYLTTYSLLVHGGIPGNHNVRVTGYVSTNFAHPSALIVESCPSTSSCNASGQFSVMSTSLAAQTAVIPAPGVAKGTTSTAGLAIFVPDNNGATAFSGTDTATVTLTLIDVTTNLVLEVDTLSLNNPNETLQTAVQLTLGTAPGGLTVTTATDYSMAFGNVNGLGIGATLPTLAAPGGIVYRTPYLLNPAFNDFTSTTATISVYVSSNFAHPAILKPEDAAANAGPYTAISTNFSAPTQITAAAGDRNSITRYLGLYVANTSGPTSFAGTDSATLTFTMTVP
ncbi:MAG TPA: hypothetical protein VKW06_15070 [Candidatus Angelobacter sp.]|nr:hypothetical protein [Candidatus Angelobacter sp.]